jgi:hypothetical protein
MFPKIPWPKIPFPTPVPTFSYGFPVAVAHHTVKPTAHNDTECMIVLDPSPTAYHPSMNGGVVTNQRIPPLLPTYHMIDIDNSTSAGSSGGKSSSDNKKQQSAVAREPATTSVAPTQKAADTPAISPPRIYFRARGRRSVSILSALISMTSFY